MKFHSYRKPHSEVCKYFECAVLLKYCVSTNIRFITNWTQNVCTSIIFFFHSIIFLQVSILVTGRKNEMVILSGINIRGSKRIDTLNQRNVYLNHWIPEIRRFQMFRGYIVNNNTSRSSEILDLSLVCRDESA